MYTTIIKIKSLPTDKIKQFVTLVSKYSLNIDLKSGNRIVDGKSAMGIFTLDLKRPVDLCIVSEKEEEVEKLISHLYQMGCL